MGRLENIIERNKHPRRHGRKGVTMGIALGLFVFVILVLMIFTDLDESPVQPEPVAPAGRLTDEKRVDGVLLYRPKPRAATVDAGATGPVPAPTAPTPAPTP